MKGSAFRNRIGLLTTAGLILTGASVHAQPLAGTPASRTASLETGVSRAEQSLARVLEGQRQGVISSEEVVQARIALAEARVRLATARQQSKAVLQNLEALVAHREELLARANERYKAGVLSSGELGAARAALAEARIRLSLNTLVAIREQELARARAAYREGIVPQGEVTKASQALDQARSRRASDQRLSGQ